MVGPNHRCESSSAGRALPRTCQERQSRMCLEARASPCATLYQNAFLGNKQTSAFTASARSVVAEYRDGTFTLAVPCSHTVMSSGQLDIQVVLNLSWVPAWSLHTRRKAFSGAPSQHTVQLCSAVKPSASQRTPTLNTMGQTQSQEPHPAQTDTNTNSPGTSPLPSHPSQPLPS